MMRKMMLLLMLGPCAWSQCGVTDVLTHVASSYMTLARPALGGSFIDPDYGCTVRRLSDGMTLFGRPMMHEYANMSAINKDDTLIEMLNTGGGWVIADLSGNVRVSSVPWGGGEGGRWSTQNARVIYWRSSNRLKSMTINADWTTTNATVYAFSEYSSIDFGGGEGDLQDTDRFVLGGECNGTTCAIGTKDVFTFDVVTGAKGAPLNLPDAKFAGYSAHIAPSGQVVIGWGATGKVPCTNGPCYYGFELFDGNMNYLRSFTRAGQHFAVLGWNGAEYLVHVDAMGTVCTSGPQGIAVIDINVGMSSAVCRKSALLPWTASVHVGTSKGNTGWIVVSHTDYENPGSASNPLATNWDLPTHQPNNQPTTAGYWGPGSNEVFIFRPDGTDLHRLVHHRSIPNATDYWKIPRATISRDGTYVVFDSDFATGTQDVYLVLAR